MGKRKPAEDDAVGSAVAVALVGFDDDKEGLDASLLVAAGAAADDKDRRVVEVMVLCVCGRCSTSARRRNILIGAMIVQPIRNAQVYSISVITLTLSR
jgi:hypothetical protein